jgi:hypothetical protein
MSEWWTYRPSSFLMFAPNTYYRLFEQYNAALWPLHLAALIAALVMLVLISRGSPAAGRIVATLLALAWGWVAWGFLWQRYATINLAAVYFAAAFALQAALLLITAVLGRLEYRRRAGLRKKLGLALFVVAIAGQPLLALALGRPWTQLEVAGLAPDPTAVATLGLILAADRIRWSLLAIPVLWCLVTGITLWTMNAADALLAPLAAVVALGLAAGLRDSRRA